MKNEPATPLEYGTASPKSYGWILGGLSVGAGCISPILMLIAYRDLGDPFPFLAYAVGLGILISSIAGLVFGVIALRAIRGSGLTRGRSVARAGIFLNILWPLVVVAIIGVSVALGAAHDKAEENAVRDAASEFLASWMQAERARAPLPEPQQSEYLTTKLGYFGKGLQPSQELENNAPAIIIVIGPELPGRTGTVIGFADGQVRYVPRSELNSVYRADQGARMRVRAPVIKWFR